MPSQPPNDNARAMPVTGFSWAGMRTNDFAAATRFFDRLFQLAPEIRTDDADFALFRLPSNQLFEIFGPKLTARQFLRAPVIGFDVEDVAAKRADMERAGVEFVTPVFDYGDGVSSSYFRGPDGHLFEIWHRP